MDLMEKYEQNEEINISNIIRKYEQKCIMDEMNCKVEK